MDIGDQRSMYSRIANIYHVNIEKPVHGSEIAQVDARDETDRTVNRVAKRANMVIRIQNTRMRPRKIVQLAVASTTDAKCISKGQQRAVAQPREPNTMVTERANSGHASSNGR